MKRIILVSVLSLSLLAGGCLTTLEQGAVDGDTSGVRTLLDQGADVNARGALGGWTPLMWAAYYGKTETVQLLLDRGADPTLTHYGNGKSAAAMAEKFSSLKQLLLRAEVVAIAKEQGQDLPPPQEAPPPAVKAAIPSKFPRSPVSLTYPKGESRPADIAVIIGNTDYAKRGRDIPDVTPAYADAEGFKRYVTQTLGVREGNIIELRDATQGDLISVFGAKDDHRGKLFNWTQAGKSNVYVYYAGHGAPAGSGGSAYLVPVDADPATLELNGYPLATLYRNLGKVPAASITVVLEACFSGASQGGSVISNASPVFLKAKAPVVPPNITVISAGGPNQMASWEKDKSHGLFTKYFLKGMSGEADTAPYGNGDGKVGYGELGAYLKGTMTYYARRYYGRDQTAQIVIGKAN